MKKSKLIFLITIILFITACGIGTSPDPSVNPEVQKQLTEAWSDFNTYIENADIPNIVSAFTTDGSYIPLNGTKLEGHTEIEEYFTNYFSTGGTKILHQELTGFFSMGDLVFQYGSQKKKLTPITGPSVILNLDYFSTFKKQTDGSWKWEILLEQ